MRVQGGALLILMPSLLIGCSVFVPEESRYLRTAADQATQDQVRQRLGQPATTSFSQGGQSVWVYEVRQLEPGSQSSWSAAGSWCDEYALTFDKGGVLRQWAHKSFFHGGENMPASCNTTLGVQKPAL
ncbi:MAG: hypothetical protein ACT4OO_05995 [Nitrospiraceae bacterium]